VLQAGLNRTREPHFCHLMCHIMGSPPKASRPRGTDLSRTWAHLSSAVGLTYTHGEPIYSNSCDLEVAPYLRGWRPAQDEK
jgi:hypothetical protein